jgi:hypothetical protein
MLKNGFYVFAVNGKVLYDAVNVSELKPNEFDVLFLDLFDYVCDVLFPNSIFKILHSSSSHINSKGGFQGIQLALDSTRISI